MDEERSYLEALANVGDPDAIVKLHHLCQRLGEEPPFSHYYLNLLEGELKENVRQQRHWKFLRAGPQQSRLTAWESAEQLNRLDAKIDNIEDIIQPIWKKINQIRQFLGLERMPYSDPQEARHSYADSIAHSFEYCECHDTYYELREHLAELEVGKAPEWATLLQVNNTIEEIKNDLLRILEIRRRLGYEFPLLEE